MVGFLGGGCYLYGAPQHCSAIEVSQKKKLQNRLFPISFILGKHVFKGNAERGVGRN